MLNQYRHIYEASYKRQRAARTAWFFDNLLRTDADVRVDATGAAGMIARTYPFLFHGQNVRLLNISRATTVPRERGMGLMTGLMCDVLRTEAEAGVAFASLTPPTRRLYFFFDRFGFATAGYIAEERYTVDHAFSAADAEFPENEAGEILRRIASRRDMAVVLNDENFALLRGQVELDGGRVVAASDAGENAVLFAGRMDSAEGMTVHALFATGEDVAESALARLEDEIEARPALTVRRDALGQPRPRLRAGAMYRIASAETVLSALAAAHPGLKTRIRLHDDIIPDNNGVFVLNKGDMEHFSTSDAKVDLDVDVKVLTSILFSAPETGSIFNLPTNRPAPLILPG